MQSNTYPLALIAVTSTPSCLVTTTAMSAPAIGDEVDVQRPLISTLVDRINWV